MPARPIYHHKHDSIEAHLAVVFAALAVTHRIEASTGWSIKRFVQTARPLPHHRHSSRPARPDRRRTTAD
jgi:hypothetical protein